jgi:succinyl-CoA synthetase alpha subunit
MEKKVAVLKNSYYDSAFLMLTSKALRQIPGIKDAALMMATESNLAILMEMGLFEPETGTTTPNDLIIAVKGESRDVLERALKAAEELLHKRKTLIEGVREYRPVSLDRALKMLPEANLVIISVPGVYASREARKALMRGLHVMLFSDHVSLEEEVRLKKLANQRGLLMMGPDCGTAIINGKPLCFANVVRRGNIGVAAASGSGLQELICLVHDLGGGISQAIGTGGRDLQKEVGGMMMLMGIEALASDTATEVIAVLSKPPARDVAEKILSRLRHTRKPCVAHFIGLETKPASENLWFSGDLEEAAAMAVALSRGQRYEGHGISMAGMEQAMEQETGRMAGTQKYLRGLYAGGTLADEAMIIFEREGFAVYSNIQTNPERILQNPHASCQHTIIDLGDDRFTMGRPHPMIDPSIRAARIEKEMEDPEVAVMLLDFVLGYGSHEDPCGSILGTLKRAKDRAKDRGGNLTVVASITGTKADYQNKDDQRKKLESIGCLVMPSNTRAALLALQIIRKVTS